MYHTCMCTPIYMHIGSMYSLCQGTMYHIIVSEISRDVIFVNFATKVGLAIFTFSRLKLTTICKRQDVLEHQGILQATLF